MSRDPVLDDLRVDIDAMFSGALDTPVSGATAGVRDHVVRQCWADLCALASRDAAAGGDPGYAYRSYASFRAVLVYRVAHQLLNLPDPDGLLRTTARRLSEEAKVRTGVEIHPAAVIGKRFVVDHGYGTVIGEQTRLGDDCYLLQGVTLGGPSIGHSSAYRQSRRHPWIGDRVEIGGGVCVFGPVTIGDDCRLEAGVRVTFDVPDGARVRLVSVSQVCLAPAPRAEVHSVSSIPDGLLVTGAGLRNLIPALLNDDRTVASYLPVLHADERSIRCGMPTVRAARARLLGLFEEANLALCIGGASALRDL